MQTLPRAAKDIVVLGSNRNPAFDNLTDSQRERLAALAIRGLGAYAHEATDEVTTSEAFNNKLAEALEEQHVKDRAVLCKELGEMLLQGAIAHCKKPINDCLDDAITELVYSKMFHDEAERVLFDDMRERTKDMNQALRAA